MFLTSAATGPLIGPVTAYAVPGDPDGASEPEPKAGGRGDLRRDIRHRRSSNRMDPVRSGPHERARAACAVTFTKDVRPIVFSACASCHRPEGIAPFPLLTYEDVRSHAPQIVAATRDRVMPPWKPEPGYGQFAGRAAADRRADRDASRDGSKAARVEGDPAQLPPPPSWSGEWATRRTRSGARRHLPTPLRATGDDVYRNFVLPIEHQPDAIRQGVGVSSRQSARRPPRDDAVRPHRIVAPARRAGPGARLRRARFPIRSMQPRGLFLGWLPGTHAVHRARGNGLAAADRHRSRS